MKNKRRVVNYAILTDKDFLKYYREQTDSLLKPDNKKIGNCDLIQKATSMIFSEVAEAMLENIGGVQMNRLGYFSIWRSNEPVITTTGYNSPKLNYHTDGYQYFLGYFPDTTKNTKLSGWSMDRTFVKSVKQKLATKLRMGYKYKNFYYMFKYNKK